MLQISHNMFLPTQSLSKSFIFPTKVWLKSTQMNCLNLSLFLWFYAQLYILTPSLPPKALFQVHSDILVNDSRKMQVIFINMSRLIWIQFQSWAPSTKLFLLSLTWFHRFSLWLESTTRSIFESFVCFVISADWLNLWQQKETLKLEAESEYRRREEAVLATKRVMAERARAVSWRCWI